MTDLGRLTRDIGGQDSPGDRLVAKLAQRQHGVAARWQLVELGLGADAIDYRLRTGRLHRLFRGVYAVGHQALPKRGRDMAAVLACGREAVLSHRSAADLWGIRHTSRVGIDVTAARGRAGHPRIEVHRARRLDDADRAVIDGIPVTSLARTFLDSAEVLRPRQVERAWEEAERLRLLDVSAVRELCARSRGRRGVAILIALCGQAIEPPSTKSDLEGLFHDLCRDHGLPMPALNVVVNGHEVDALWEQAKLIVEVDSWEFHKSREQFERDRERDAVHQLAGYRVIRITWRRLTREPAQLAEIILRLLAGSPSTTRS